MPKGEGLGEFEQLVMLAVLRLGRDAYGMRIRQEIAARTGRDASIGAVYATLERLAEKGFLKAGMSDPTPERGGRAKRSFAITGAGTEAVTRALQEMANMIEGLKLPMPEGSQ